MPRHRPYRPSPTCPHTYGVRPWSCPAIATEPCRPTACAGEQSHLTDYPPPFRHTPVYSWPRPTATVWRNLRQHPRRYETYTFSAKEKDSETGLSCFGSRYYSSDLSVWLSVDPMSDKYPSLSPYVYCANNPVKLVDPNGDTISLLGDDWESALAHMQKYCPNLEISRGENGCLSYSYKKGVKFNQKGAAIVSDEETMFCKVIDSKEVKVSLTANYKNVYTAKNGKQYKSNMGGGFLGSTYNGNKTADAEQFVSMILLNKYYASEDIGRLLLHEATEAYWGGERAIELQRNTCVPQSNIFGQYKECGDYNYAHNKAISQPTTRFEKFMSRTSYDLLLYHLGKGH